MHLADRTDRLHGAINLCKEIEGEIHMLQKRLEELDLDFESPDFAETMVANTRRLLSREMEKTKTAIANELWADANPQAKRARPRL